MLRHLIANEERMVKLGFFQTPADCEQYVEDLLALAADHSRLDLAWKYGIDRDLLDRSTKETEARNWLRYLLASGCGTNTPSTL